MSTGKISIDLKQREVEVLAAYVSSLKSKPDACHPFAASASPSTGSS